MATILDNLTENLKTWTNTAASRAGEITKAAAIKAEELGKIGRLKMEVYQLQRQRQRFMGDLGEVAYGLIKKSTAPEALVRSEGVEKLMQRLSDLNAKIKSKEAEIDAVSTPASRPSIGSAPTAPIAVAKAGAGKAKSGAGTSSAKTATKRTAKKPVSKPAGKRTKAVAKKSKSSAKTKS
ncbi:MAG: hypothetical protein IIA59_06595 [Candidatus Marinimicrobia bacterium]|nr:hypothetical protein [Candidatus Neomarinimicrobiota bacterium]